MVNCLILSEKQTGSILPLQLIFSHNLKSVGQAFAINDKEVLGHTILFLTCIHVLGLGHSI